MANLSVPKLVARLREIQQFTEENVFERTREIEASICAYLSDTSIVFIGTPGTGKTHMVRVLNSCFDTKLFDILMSETTKPDTIFGPIDIPALAEGIQRHKYHGYAPDCETLFFDEVFKASGIVLNPLLRLFLEHEYNNGDEGIIKCPTLVVFAASNELPTDAERAAIYDRFLMRFEVEPLRDPVNIKKMLTLPGKLPDGPKMSKKELLALIEARKLIRIPAAVYEAAMSLRDLVARSLDIEISDRRLRKSFGVMQARALLHGRDEVNHSDLELLASMFWNSLEQNIKCRALVLNSANPDSNDLLTYRDVADEYFETALSTGDFDGSRKRMASILESIEGYRESTTGREVYTAIEGLVKRLDSLTAQRTTFAVSEVHSPRDGIYFKVNAGTAALWSKKQLRAIGFSLFDYTYWWGYNIGYKSTPKEIAANRADLTKFLKDNHKVVPSFTVLDAERAVDGGEDEGDDDDAPASKDSKAAKSTTPKRVTVTYDDDDSDDVQPKAKPKSSPKRPGPPTGKPKTGGKVIRRPII